jgi:hypothetical protein
VSELTSELQRMADDAARQTRPPAVAEIVRQGNRRRRRSLTRRSLGGLSGAGVVGAGVALGLGLTGSAPAHGTATIRTAAFTLVSNANGTATLSINPKVLLEPGTLQRDLARDGIRAMVTVGRFCDSDPAPAGWTRVMSFPGSPADPGPVQAVVIHAAAMPAGTELSFGNFQLGNGAQTSVALIDTGSYTCTTTTPTAPPPHGVMITMHSSRPW